MSQKVDIEDQQSQAVNIDGYQTYSKPANGIQKKQPIDFKITERKLLVKAPEVVEFTVYAPNVADHCEPGQFVIVIANEKAERVPLTIADFDRQKHTITIVCQNVGRSSFIINAMQAGQSFKDIAGPLGTPSDVRENMGNVVLIGGGLGVAPVYPIARKIHQLAGNHVINIFGARSKDIIIWEDKMKSVSSEYVITTDDGSYGTKGFGSTVLKQMLLDTGYKENDETAKHTKEINLVFAIGPLPMMKSVVDVCEQFHVPSVVSLNTIMVDGTGMCGACRIELDVPGQENIPKDQRKRTTKFACVDGPDFDGGAVDWTGLRTRMGAYKAEEKNEKEQPIVKVHSEKTIAKDVSVEATPMPVQPAAFRAQNFNEVALGYTLEMAQQEANRCLNCPKPNCIKGCPVQVPINQFIHQVRLGNILEAYKIIKRANPCPSLSGRVCPQENQCQCGEGDYGCILSRLHKQPVQIGKLERFVADYVRENGLEKEAMKNEQGAIEPVKQSGVKCAVIGSGPAGIACANELGKAGHQVTIFESLHKAGGVLSYGIPQFRLPKEIVQREIEVMSKSSNISVQTDFVVGKSATIADLRKEGYSAFFIGSGAGLPRFLNIPGEDLPGVVTANELLTRVNLMKAYKFPFDSDTPIKHEQQVIVIGSGNVAMDAARVSKRLGAQVSIVYRKRFQDMPARKEEIEHAEEEGIDFKTLNTPLEIVPNCDNTGVKGLKTQVMEVNQEGKIVPKGTETAFITAQMVVLAIGQGSNKLLSSATPELKINERGLILSDEEQMTNIPGVFCGGDCNTGAATVIKALGAGKKAGINMCKWIEENKDKCNIDKEIEGKLYYPEM